MTHDETDLVKRLRNRRGCSTMSGVISLTNEAADEIERFRSPVDERVQDALATAEQFSDVIHEIEALEGIIIPRRIDRMWQDATRSLMRQRAATAKHAKMKEVEG